jgi:hypothetical protein
MSARVHYLTYPGLVDIEGTTVGPDHRGDYWRATDAYPSTDGRERRTTCVRFELVATVDSPPVDPDGRAA